MAGWWFGTWLSFSPIVGMMIQSDELHHFSEGLKPHQVDSGKSHDVYACGLVTVPQIHTAASDSLRWGGVGWDDNVIGIATWSWCYALWSSLAIPHDLDATLYDLHWQIHMILMLHCLIFNCHCTHPHPIVCGGVEWCGVGWDDNVIGIATWSWCYALWSSLAIPHDLDATLYDLHWQFHMILMLRSLIFNCHCTHPHPIVWGGVGWDDNEKGPGTQSSNMEMHAFFPVAVGVRR